MEGRINGKGKGRETGCRQEEILFSCVLISKIIFEPKLREIQFSLEKVANFIYTEKKDIVIVTKKENYSQMTDYHWIILLI